MISCRQRQVLVSLLQSGFAVEVVPVDNQLAKLAWTRCSIIGGKQTHYTEAMTVEKAEEMVEFCRQWRGCDE